MFTLDGSILPTGTCFNDALELLEAIARDNVEDNLQHYALVHALCIIPPNGVDAGQPFAHAWLEKWTPKGTEAWQSGIWNGIRITYAVASKELVELLRPQCMWKYSVLDALEQNRRHGNFGPWEDVLRAHCRGTIATPAGYGHGV